MTTTTPELRLGPEDEPCRFCKGRDLSVRPDYSEDEPTRIYAWHVFCHDCHARGRNNYPIGWCETPEAARQAWNDLSTGRRRPLPVVRPLSWHESRGELDGQLVWSSGDPWVFWIVKNPTEPRYIWCENFNIEGFCPASPVRGSFDSLDEAKAAAQRDYDARIMAALDLSRLPEPEPVAAPERSQDAPLDTRPQALLALRDRVLRAVTTASNDDLSKPQTDKRTRHVERLTVLHDVAEMLETLAEA